MEIKRQRKNDKTESYITTNIEKEHILGQFLKYALYFLENTASFKQY